MTLSSLGKFASLGLLTLGLATGGGAFALVGANQGRDVPSDNAPQSGRSDPDPLASFVPSPTSKHGPKLDKPVVEGPTIADPGEEVWYRLKVKNSGDAPARDVTIAIRIPTEVDPQAAKPSGALWKDSNRTLSWHMDTLETGESPDFEVRVRFASHGTRLFDAGIKARDHDLALTRHITEVRQPGRVEQLRDQIDQVRRQLEQVKRSVRHPDNDPAVTALRRMHEQLTAELEKTLANPIDIFDDRSGVSIARQFHPLAADESLIVPTEPQRSLQREVKPAVAEPTTTSDTVRQSRQDQEQAIRTAIQQLEIDRSNIDQSVRTLKRSRLLLDARREQLEDHRAKLLKEIEGLNAELDRLNQDGEPNEYSDAPE